MIFLLYLKWVLLLCISITNSSLSFRKSLFFALPSNLVVEIKKESYSALRPLFQALKHPHSRQAGRQPAGTQLHYSSCSYSSAVKVSTYRSRPAPSLPPPPPIGRQGGAPAFLLVGESSVPGTLTNKLKCRIVCCTAYTQRACFILLACCLQFVRKTLLSQLMAHSFQPLALMTLGCIQYSLQKRLEVTVVFIQQPCHEAGNNSMMTESITDDRTFQLPMGGCIGRHKKR